VPGLKIQLGLELGEGNHHPEAAKKVYGTPGTDFIIGSVHALRGLPDFYLMEYKSEEHCAELNRKYLEEYLELSRLGTFDVLGHVGYTSRYMFNAGFKTSLLPFMDMVEELFKIVIAAGKGIEVNTAGLRNPVGEFAPVPEILALYRRLGGEILTVGSDAHYPEHAGNGVREAYELIRQCGFKYISVFRQHKPEFVKL
jgi:histidinol-phosphatase (PHP family)